jgi:hypothetical protein
VLVVELQRIYISERRTEYTAERRVAMSYVKQVRAWSHGPLELHDFKKYRAAVFDPI